MVYRFYTNLVSQASRHAAATIFTAGLGLMGFGFLIYLLPRLFATLAAIVFFVMGVGCVTTAVKLFWSARRLDKMTSKDSQGHRKNVQIHIEEHYDV